MSHRETTASHAAFHLRPLRPLRPLHLPLRGGRQDLYKSWMDSHPCCYVFQVKSSSIYLNIMKNIYTNSGLPTFN